MNALKELVDEVLCQTRELSVTLPGGKRRLTSGIPIQAKQDAQHSALRPRLFLIAPPRDCCDLPCRAVKMIYLYSGPADGSRGMVQIDSARVTNDHESKYRLNEW